MARRRVWLAGTVVTVIAVAGLLAAGSGAIPVRTFALGAPDGGQVALLHPHDRVCEGPVVSPTAFNGVGVFGTSGAGVARLTITAEDPSSHRVLASGSLQTPPAPGEEPAFLGRTLDAGRPLRICVTDTLSTFSLGGSSAVRPDVVMTGAGVGPGGQFSLVLLNRSRSLLASLPTAFSRASLWRPSWVGRWTFWVLAAALLGAFVAAIVAVAAAASADDDAADGTEPGDTTPPPTKDGISDPLEAGASR